LDSSSLRQYAQTVFYQLLNNVRTTTICDIIFFQLSKYALFPVPTIEQVIKKKSIFLVKTENERKSNIEHD